MPLTVVMTDFGAIDCYVAEMKSVLFQNGCEQIVDLTHEVRSGNVRQGQFLLMTSFRQFPENTVFLAVVDPGVGTDRQAVAIRYLDRWFVGPDNGLFSFAASGSVFSIVGDNLFSRRLSETFHGRDLFAPAAGQLASGNRSCLGSATSLLVLKPISIVTTAEVTRSEVMHIDHFGNLITGIANQLAGQV